jgi:hypothetical protein
MEKMHNIAGWIVAAGAAAFFACALARAGVEPSGAMARLVRAYPGSLCGADGNAIVWCDGARTAFDDGREKSFDERLARADLEDQMSQEYPPPAALPPRRDEDPGRIRCLSFFEKMYGATRRAVETNLETVTWLPGVADRRVSMTRVNGVAEKLAAVSSELLGLDRADVDRVRRVGGAFVWRRIAGTERTSPHGFGIAIDLAVGRSHYWRWDRVRLGEIGRRFDDIPMAVVRAFERHGFIWGGRWYHYDTMHFEYRPELAPPDPAAGNQKRPSP